MAFASAFGWMLSLAHPKEEMKGEREANGRERRLQMRFAPEVPNFEGRKEGLPPPFLDKCVTVSACVVDEK